MGTVWFGNYGVRTVPGVLIMLMDIYIALLTIISGVGLIGFTILKLVKKGDSPEIVIRSDCCKQNSR